MNKKILFLIGVIVLIAVGATMYFLFNEYSKREVNHKPENQLENSNEKDRENMNSNNKSVVIYFSATGTTQSVAKTIQSVTKGDIIEIIPKEKYTSADLNYSNNDCRANKEQNNASARPEIANTINVESYDTIYLGYPIWWGDVPKIILTFLDTYNLEGKTVIPFCTSGGSSISTSMNTLRKYNNKINWLDGKKLSSSVSTTEIENWINDLNN